VTEAATLQAPAGEPGMRVLIVDDEPGVRQVVTALLRREGYVTEAVDSVPAAMERIGQWEVDIVVTDIMMPGLSGIDLLKMLHERVPEVPVVVMTGHPDTTTAAEALRTSSAVDYVEKPFATPVLLRVVERAAGIKRTRDRARRLAAENENYRLHLEEMVRDKSAELARAYDEIRASYEFTLEAMAAMLDARESTTGRHSVRVRDLALILGRAMALPAAELDDIARGTLLHDIGKIAIPDAILLKPGKLTQDEWTVMRSHVRFGYDIVRTSDYFAPAAAIILAHHEKYDGSGYPRGLKGAEICLGARIFAVVDAYDAMRSVRVYKPSISPEDAQAEIVRCSGTHFDPAIVEVFLRCRDEIERVGGWSAAAAR